MKQFTIHSSPNVLCLHIKRFQWPNRSKITTVVEFPETLDLREFMKVFILFFISFHFIPFCFVLFVLFCFVLFCFVFFHFSYSLPSP